MCGLPVFLITAKSDAVLVREFEQRLDSASDGQLRLLHAGQIAPGSNVDEAIAQDLASADAGLLFLTPNLIADREGRRQTLALRRRLGPHVLGIHIRQTSRPGPEWLQGLPMLFEERALLQERSRERAWTLLTEQVLDWCAENFPGRLAHGTALREVERNYRQRLPRALAASHYFVEPVLAPIKAGNPPQGQVLSPWASVTPSMWLSQQPASLILGGSASGKSHLLAGLALAATNSGRIDSSVQAVTASSATWQEQAQPMLPLLISFGRCERGKRHKDSRTWPAVLDLACQSAAEHLSLDLAMLQRLVRCAMWRGRLLLLCDGLNEIADIDARRCIENSLLTLVQRLSRQPGNRIAISSQTMDRASVLHSSELGLAVIQQLSQRQIKLFLTTAASHERASPASKDHASRIAETTWAELRNEPVLLDLVANPQLLSMLFQIRLESALALPTLRVELFEHYLAKRLQQLAASRPNPQRYAARVEHCLAQLALRLLEEGRRGAVSASTLHSELRDIVSKAAHPSQPRGRSESTEHFIQHLLAELPGRSGIWVEVGRQQLAFAHESYLAFFAAKALCTLSPQQRWECLHPRFYDPSWHETLCLHLGLLSMGLAGKKDAKAFIERLLRLEPQSDFERQQKQRLTLALLSEVDSTLSNAVGPLVDDLSRQLDSAVPQVRSEASAGLARLAALGNVSAQELLRRELEKPRPDARFIDGARQMLLKEPYGVIGQRLRQLLDHPAPDVQRLAIQSLRGRIPYEPALQETLKTFLTHPEDEVQQAAYSALIPLWADEHSLRETLRAQMRGADLQGLRALRSALSAIELDPTSDPDLVQIMCERLRSAPPEIQSVIAVGLIGQAITNSEVRDLVLAVVDQGSETNDLLLSSLFLPSRFSRELRDAVLKRIAGTWPSMRSGQAVLTSSVTLSALSLLDLRDPAVWPVILAKLEHPLALVRSHAATSLANADLHNPVIVDALWARVHDDKEDSGVRTSALATLRPLVATHSDWWRTILQRYAGATAPGSSMIEAQRALVAFDPRIFRRLRERLEQEAHPATRRALLTTLWQQPSHREELSKLLFSGLHDPDAEMVALSLSLLAPYLPAKALADADVQSCLAHSDHRVRRTALDWLLQLPADPLRDAQLLLRLDVETSFVLFLRVLVSLAPVTRSDVGSFLRATKAVLRFSKAQTPEHQFVLRFYLLDQLAGGPDPSCWLQRLAEENPQLAQEFSERMTQLQQIRALSGLLPAAQTNLIHSPLLGIPAGYAGAYMQRMAQKQDQNLDGFVDQLLSSQRPRLHEAAIGIMATMPEPAQQRWLQQMLAHPNLSPQHRDTLRLATTLGDENRESGTSVLESLLSNENVALRLEALKRLLPRIRCDPELGLRLAPWLGMLAPDGLEVEVRVEELRLGPSIAEQVAWLRWELAAALAVHLPHEHALYEATHAHLESPRWPARQAAAWALSQMKPRPCEPLLQRLRGLLSDLRTDDDLQERLQAAHAIHAIVQSPHGQAKLSISSDELYQFATAALQYGCRPWEMNHRAAAQVRSTAVRLIADLPSAERSRKLLKEVATQDPNEALRDLASTCVLAIEKRSAPAATTSTPPTLLGAADVPP